MEMCGADYVVAITTFMDTQEGLLRLKRALSEIDSRIGQKNVQNEIKKEIEKENRKRNRKRNTGRDKEG